MIYAGGSERSKQRIKPVKLMWTQNWRRKNKKGKADEAGKKRTKRAAKARLRA